MVWRRGGKGHVAFVYGRDSVSGEIIVLGGNQNDSINFMLQSDTTKFLLATIFLLHIQSWVEGCFKYLMS